MSPLFDPSSRNKFEIEQALRSAQASVQGEAVKEAERAKEKGGLFEAIVGGLAGLVTGGPVGAAAGAGNALLTTKSDNPLEAAFKGGVTGLTSKAALGEGGLSAVLKDPVGRASEIGALAGTVSGEVSPAAGLRAIGSLTAGRAKKAADAEKAVLEKKNLVLRNKAIEQKSEADKEKAKKAKRETAGIIQQNEDLMSNIDKLAAQDFKGAIGTLSGKALELLPGSPAKSIRTDVKTLIADKAKGTIKSMREGSASGSTGFGQLSEKELALIEAAAVSLDPDLDEKKFRSNLKHFRELLEDANKRISRDAFGADYSFGVTVDPFKIKAVPATRSSLPGKAYTKAEDPLGIL